MSDGSASNLRVNASATFYMSGGSAEGTVVHCYGQYGRADRDAIMYMEGGVANNTLLFGEVDSRVYEDMSLAMHISSGAVANNTVLSCYYESASYYYDNGHLSATLHVSSGGSASNTTLNAGWYYGRGRDYLYNNLLVSSGGSVETVTANDRGFVHVYDGGYAKDLSINGGAILFVSGGAVASDARIKGETYLFGGGSADNLIVDGGLLHVSSGGTATKVTWNPGKGHVSAAYGAVVEYVSNYSGVYGFGGNTSAVANVTLNEGNRGYIFKNGVIDNATVRGSMYIYNLGALNSASVRGGNAVVYLSSGAVARETTVRENGTLQISGGGVAVGVAVNSAGNLYIASGGTATNVDWTPGVGRVSAADGAEVTYLSRYTGIYLGSNNKLLTSAKVIGNQTYDHHSMYVMAGGTAGVITLYYGSAFVHSGGVMNNTVLHHKEGNNNAPRLYVSNGGVANITTLNSKGILQVFSGGVANSTTVNGNASGMYVYAGGVASDIVLYGDTYLHVSGGSAVNVRLNDTADVYVHSGGVVDNVYVNAGCSAHINAGGTANSLTLAGAANNRGIMHVFGTMNDTVIKSDAFLYASSGAVINNTSIDFNGKMFLYSGATLTGSLTVGGELEINSGVTIADLSSVNIDISEKGVYDVPAINTMAAGLDSAAFTITVSNHQESGTYELISSGVTRLDGDITVSDGTTTLGTITVGGGEFEFGDYIFSLNISSGKLNFVVEGTPVLAPVVTASVETLTNKDITLTATFDSKSGKNEYSTDNGTSWKVYTGAITVKDNGTYMFRSLNADGSYVETTYEVTNIDKTAPVITVTSDVTDTSVKVDEVTLSVEGDEELGDIFFSYDNKNWTKCTDTLQVVFNGTIYFKATDLAGNTGTASITVTNIDEKGPMVIPEHENLTNEDVRLTIRATSTAAVKEYSYDKETWLTRPDTLVVKENCTLYFRDIDKDGNVTEIIEYVVDYIDKEAPNAIAAVTQKDSGNSLELSWTDPGDNGKAGIVGYNYRFGETPELAVEELFTENNSIGFTGFTEEGTRYFQVQTVDAAGNLSEWSEVFTVPIDLPPVLTITGNTEIPVYESYIEVSAFSDGVNTPVYYSTDGKSYTLYTGGLTIENNGTWYFKSTDAGGHTAEQSITFTNIDKSLPKGPVVTPNVADPTRKNVTLSVEFTGNAIKKQYSHNGIRWYDYTAPVVVMQNATVYFRENNLFGHFSDVVTYEVTNIDKVVPLTPETVNFSLTGGTLTVDWEDAADNEGGSGIASYNLRWGGSETLIGKGTSLSESAFEITGLSAGKYYFQLQSVDKAGNISGWSEVVSFEIPGTITDLQGDANGITWSDAAEAGKYVVSYSKDNFENVLTVETTTTALDTYGMAQGTYQWSVKTDSASVTGSEITAEGNAEPALFQSDADGAADLFFANASGVWGKGYAAENQTTGERVFLAGRNKIADIFEGSADAGVLVMTDDANGDALFVDDIYTALGESARFAQINEIRAGAGDDIVDMTTVRYNYEGSSIKIYGGDGNDILWGGAESNLLSGGAGDDRLAGGTGDDILSGGSGDDVMQGGGGNDTFIFAGDFGKDRVEQLSDGAVTLHFEEGSEENWNADTLTYSDGTNSVTVTGVGFVTLSFGSLAESGFDEEGKNTIFEEQNKAMLA